MIMTANAVMGMIKELVITTTAAAVVPVLELVGRQVWEEVLVCLARRTLWVGLAAARRHCHVRGLEAVERRRDLPALGGRGDEAGAPVTAAADG